MTLSLPINCVGQCYGQFQRDGDPATALFRWGIDAAAARHHTGIGRRSRAADITSRHEPITLPPALDDFGEVRAVARHAVEVPHRGREQIGLALVFRQFDQECQQVRRGGHRLGERGVDRTRVARLLPGKADIAPRQPLPLVVRRNRPVRCILGHAPAYHAHASGLRQVSSP
jgi:hypothetical protein